MDELAYHPYPRRDTDSLTTGILWPNAGATDLDRIKQAVWDAFHGTGQQTFEDGLRVRLDEVGWQVAVPRNRLGAYFGAETVEPTTEASQASIYASLVRYEACDPSVDALLFLGLRDEPNLSRWQAGLMRADGSPRPSYRSVQTVLSETGGNCVGRCARGGTRRPWMAPQRPFRAAVACRGGSAPGASPQQPPKTRASERASTACARAGDRCASCPSAVASKRT